MKGDTPELVSATTAPERRVFIAVVGVLNLLFLALDVTFPFPHPAAVIGGRVAISVLFAWMAWRLARPIDARRLRALLVAFAFLATACFGLLAWGAGGVAGPYLDFMPLLPLVVIVAIPDEPGAPLASGLAGGTLALGMEMARHASPGRIVLLVLAFGSSTLYGWAGTFLFRRMRLREREAERKRAEARDALEVALRQSRRNEALYRAMAASFPEGVIALFDEELRAVLVDGAAAELQVEAAQVAGRRARDFLPAELADPVEAAQRRALSGESASLEIRAAGRDVALSFHPVRGDGGNVLL
ncbi:MAG TPA: PAS domain-containing protein, partial [Anaeromyxobacteraceae bacterium]|nr:PAS domain-containing protein [Anaeromyxobacteraceae bacterium]